MKVWIKITAGAVLGILLGFFLPTTAAVEGGWLSNIHDLGIRLLRYILFALIATSLVVALYDLKRELRLASVVGRSILYGFGSSLILTFIGGFVLTVFPPHPIPILSRTETTITVPNFFDILTSAFPTNALTILTGSADLLLPLFIFALILGLALYADKRDNMSPTVTLLDSLSRILYRINALVVELSGFFLPFISAYMVVQLRNVTDGAFYFQAALMMASVVLLAVLGIFPLIYYFLSNRRNPYKVLFANLGASLLAFFSGDVFAAQGALIRQTRENLGVSRKVGAFTMPYLALFSRGGTAMVSLIGFYVVLRSYSSLDVTLEQFLWSLGASFLTGFLLPSVPGLGAYVSMMVLCQWYGKGLESAFLNLAPIIVWMSGFAALVDVTVSGMITSLIGQKEGVLRHIELKKFI